MNVEFDGTGAKDPSPVESGNTANPASRILVVDDDKTLNVMVSVALRKLGYSVDSAENGESAWDAIQSKPFDLLITDYSMPRLNGLELLRKLRNNSFTVPAILMSAAMPQQISEIIELVSPGGALHKPFQIKELYFRVGSILDDAQQERAGNAGETRNRSINSSRENRAAIRQTANSNLSEIAGSLLAYESPAGGVKDPSLPIFKVCDKMRGYLTNLAGETGFQSILAHALALSRPDVEWLRTVRISSQGFFEGLRQAEENLTQSEISRGETVVVTHMLNLLFSFLGESVTRALLHDIWWEVSFTNRPKIFFG